MNKLFAALDLKTLTTHVPYVDLKIINYPLVELDLVGVDDADEHALERFDNNGTLPNRFLVKKYLYNMYHCLRPA